MSHFSAAQRLVDNIQTAFIGNRDVVELAVAGLFCNGHLLIEDAPGVGKTTLARALARSISCSFRRIQFTPDLLPSDIIGVSVYNSESHGFDFKPGPLFANVILADEINRTTPRTQSSLLEAMNDQQVTVDGHRHVLESPFMVVATQNPYEYEGTYPLPESQLDRFFMRIAIGYPSRESEREILRTYMAHQAVEELEPVMGRDQVVQIQETVKNVTVEESLLDYVLDVAERTRSDEGLRLGLSPRGGLALVRGMQAMAFMAGRDYCMPDDLKRVAAPIVCHRVIPASNAGPDYAADIVAEILTAVPVPV